MAFGKQIKEIMERVPVVERHGDFFVVREDTLPGGAKMRFLPYLTDNADEVVFGGPFCGGAPLALSYLGKYTGQKVTLFYAKRKELHPRQKKAKENGAQLKFVRPGYMTVVQAKAKRYAAKMGALFLELGFDMPQSEVPFVKFLRERVGPKIAKAPEIWCATGSGMLARHLSLAFPKKKIYGVAVGLKSRHDKQVYQKNVTIVECPYEFQEECKVLAPFQSCPNYDRKAWEQMVLHGKKGAVLYNVL